jgi:transposase-like protein
MANNNYTEAYKQEILKQMQPPENKTIMDVVNEYGIKKSTLYGWVTKARKKGQLIPNSHPSNQTKWRTIDKMRIVMETYAMNEEELGAYCRKHGLYTTDIKRWSEILESSMDSDKPIKEIEKELKTEQEKKKALEKELKYKEKALAEAAALLVLRKKADAIWEDPEGE